MPQNQPVISNSKIILFVVFVCAALMTSLFIYHSSQKPAALKLDPELGMIFNAPRDIKSFELMAAENQTFTEKNLRDHWTLLFFGFTHCASVCPATFDVIKRVYPQLHEQYPNLQVVLISVDAERDTPESLASYTKAYHPDFMGVTGKIQEIRKLQSQLGVYAARETSNDDTNYQIQHTASIMLVNPKGQWMGLFKVGIKPDELLKAVQTSIG